MPLFRLVSWLNLREPPYSRHENAARFHEILGTMSKTLKQKRGQTTSKTTAKIIAKILAVYYRKPRRQFITFYLTLHSHILPKLKMSNIQKRLGASRRTVFKSHDLDSKTTVVGHRGHMHRKNCIEEAIEFAGTEYCAFLAVWT